MPFREKRAPPRLPYPSKCKHPDTSSTHRQDYVPTFTCLSLTAPPKRVLPGSRSQFPLQVSVPFHRRPSSTKIHAAPPPPRAYCHYPLPKRTRRSEAQASGGGTRSSFSPNSPEVSQAEPLGGVPVVLGGKLGCPPKFRARFGTGVNTTCQTVHSRGTCWHTPAVPLFPAFPTCPNVFHYNTTLICIYDAQKSDPLFLNAVLTSENRLSLPANVPSTKKIERSVATITHATSPCHVPASSNRAVGGWGNTESGKDGGGARVRTSRGEGGGGLKRRMGAVRVGANGGSCRPRFL